MLRWLLAGFVAVFPTLSLAQAFPERPVRIIVPLTPGGSPDTIARALAQGLQGVWLRSFYNDELHQERVARGAAGRWRKPARCAWWTCAWCRATTPT